MSCPYCGGERGCSNCNRFFESVQRKTKDERIAKLEAENEQLRDQWLPVSEPPEEYGTYLTKDAKGLLRLSTFNPHGAGWVDRRIPVIHWMPIPPHNKGEG